MSTAYLFSLTKTSFPRRFDLGRFWRRGYRALNGDVVVGRELVAPAQVFERDSLAAKRRNGVAWKTRYIMI